MSTHESGTAVELSIGEVLALIQEDFPDVTISKIRFLESQGLIQPGRTAAGYRRFGDTDIERLRWILRQQRDHFLPLKVIRRMLDDGIDQFDDDPAQPTLWSRSFSDEDGDDADELDDDELDDDLDDEFDDDDDRRAADAAFIDAVRGGVGRASSGEARDRPGAAARHPGRGAASAAASRPSAPAAAGGGSDGSGPGSNEAAPRRVLETPADVVAALQEDPRPARRPAGPTAAEPPSPSTRRRPALWDDAPGSDQPTRSAAELCEASGISVDALAELEQFGLIRPARRAGESYYGDGALEVARLASRAATHGISARHLRMYLVSAEREAGFIEQLAMPLLKQRNPGSRTEAVELSAEIAGLGAELHAALLRRELGPVLGEATAHE